MNSIIKFHVDELMKEIKPQPLSYESVRKIIENAFVTGALYAGMDNDVFEAALEVSDKA